MMQDCKRRRKETKHKVHFEPDVDLKELLELLKDEHVFETHVKHFLRPVISTKWKAGEQNKQIQSVVEVVSIRDETFVLLALEDDWERWIDINNKCENKQLSQMFCHGAPLSTARNKRRVKTKARHQKGWNDMSIKRLNVPCKLLKKTEKMNGQLTEKLINPWAQMQHQDNNKNRNEERLWSN